MDKLIKAVAASYEKGDKKSARKKEKKLLKADKKFDKKIAMCAKKKARPH